MAFIEQTFCTQEEYKKFWV